MPKGPQPKPGHISRPDARAHLGVGYGTYHRWVTSGKIQDVLGLPKDQIDIPQDLFLKHISKLKQLGSPHVRSSKAGKDLTNQDAQRQASLKVAIEEVRNKKPGQYSRSTLLTLARTTVELSDDIHSNVAAHKRIQKQKNMEYTKEWGDKQRAENRQNAINAVLSGKPGHLPKWAVFTLRGKTDIPKEVLIQLAEHRIEKRRLAKFKNQGKTPTPRQHPHTTKSKEASQTQKKKSTSEPEPVPRPFHELSHEERIEIIRQAHNRVLDKES